MSLIQKKTSTIAKILPEDPLKGLSKEEFILKLKSELLHKVKELYLFGSITKGTLHPNSDIDIIIVQETQTPFHKRPLNFPEIDLLCPRADVLVYTPEEFDKIKNERHVGFWKDVFENLLKII